MLDGKNTGRLPIRDVVGSDSLAELMRLADPNKEGFNWFSLENAQDIYRQVLQCDWDDLLLKFLVSAAGQG